MVKLIVYLVGGTARIGKILLHLMSAGALQDVKSVDFIKVDSDNGNGDTSDVNGLIESFKRNKECFGITYDVNNLTWKYKDVLNRTLVGRGGEVESLFTRFIDPTGITYFEKKKNELLLRSQFSNEEIYTNTNGGFFGRNSLGATFVGCARMNKEIYEQVKATIFLDKIITSTADSYRIIICGSIFGGTGAALTLPLAEQIGEYIKKKDGGIYFPCVKIGCATLLPYFKYDWEEGETKAPNPDEFYEATYNSMKNMESFMGGFNSIYRDEIGNGLFDRMYFFGNEELENTQKAKTNADQGVKQNNNMTVTDFVAAGSVVHFANETIFNGEEKLMFYDLGNTDCELDENQKHTKKHVLLSELPFGEKMFAYGKFCLVVAYQYMFINSNKRSTGKEYCVPKNIKTLVKKNSYFQNKYDAKSKDLFDHCSDFITRLNEINNGKDSNNNTINKVFFGDSIKNNGLFRTYIDKMNENSNELNKMFIDIFKRIKNQNANEEDIEKFATTLTFDKAVKFSTENVVAEFKKKVFKDLPDGDEECIEAVFCKLFEYIKGL